MKVTLHPAAEQDIEDAATFYEREGTPMLAARFVTEFTRLATFAHRPSEHRFATVERSAWFFYERLPLHRHLPCQRSRD